ncbi:MAG: SMP-30/gluconolactonase/LRE family protein [Nanoarchaeota archaeon]|nr:SMP-30/gluconolactonase/LRE family protein [Nanoarchaeota archaeon]
MNKRGFGAIAILLIAVISVGILLAGSVTYLVIKAYQNDFVVNNTIPTVKPPVTGVTICGDSLIGVGEQCDDGGRLSGDGCSSVCRLESGYRCIGIPSVCVKISTGSTTTGGRSGGSSTGGSTGECVIESTDWSKVSILFGESVDLIVQGTDCEAETLTLDVYRQEAGGDVLVNSVSGVAFSPGTIGTAEKTWTSPSSSGGIGGFGFFFVFFEGSLVLLAFALTFKRFRDKNEKLLIILLAIILVVMVVLLLFSVIKIITLEKPALAPTVDEGLISPDLAPPPMPSESLIDNYYFVATTEGANPITTTSGLLEVGNLACSDTIDNDNDGLIDDLDPGCYDSGAYDPLDNNESDVLSECSDFFDNELIPDGWIDYPEDPGCVDANDDDEVNTNTGFQCSNNIDDDGDGLIDGNDPGCVDWQDDDELDFAQSSGWDKLNNRNPVDADDGFDSFLDRVDTPYGDRTFTDSNGNLLFFYLGADPSPSSNADERSANIGRLSSSEEWEFLTTNGIWSNSVNAVPLNLLGQKSGIETLRVFEDPSNPDRIFGIAVVEPANGAIRFDAHGKGYNFILDLTTGEFSFWTKDGQEPHHGQPLLSSWGGNQAANLDFDFSSEEGLYIAGERFNIPYPDNLIAARFTTANGWENWFNDQWDGRMYLNPNNRDYDILSFMQNGRGIKPLPIVRNIPGTRDFIITYVYNPDRLRQTAMRAAMYSGASGEWSVWNGTSWNSDLSSSADIYVPQYSTIPPIIAGHFINRKALVVGQVFYQFVVHKNDFGNYDVVMISYDHVVKQWSEQVVTDLVSKIGVFRSNRIVVAENNGEIWLVVEDGIELKLLKYIGGSWTTPEIIYTSDSVFPYALDFFNNRPVLFIREEYLGNQRLFAFSDKSTGAWANEIPKPFRASPPGRVRLDSTEGRELIQWDLNINASITEPVSPPLTYNYEVRPINCLHMDIDDVNVYCTDPHWGTPGVGIYPLDYDNPSTRLEETAHYWGDNTWGGYFNWMGGIAIDSDSARNKVYIGNWLYRQSNIMPTGDIQIWDRTKSGENLARVVRIGGQRIPINSPYAPEKITTIGGNRIQYPNDLAVNPITGDVYLAESGANRIVKFNYNPTTGSLENPSFIGTTGEGKLDFPIGIDTDSMGNIYVADSHNHRIVKFTPSGAFVTSWGSAGRDDGEFIYPHSLAVDKTMNKVYVADPYNQRLQIFDLNGDFVYAFNNWQQSSNPNSVPVTDNFAHITGVAARDGFVYVGVNPRPNSPFGTIVKFQMNLP